MQKVFWLLILAWGAVWGVEKVPYEAVAYGGEPSGVVGGCVNVITGDYVVREVDWVVRGHEPIVIERRHLSSKAKGSRWCGWEFFFKHLRATREIIEESFDAADEEKATFATYRVVIPEKYGFSLAYEGKFLNGMPDGQYKLQGDYPHALTNCYTGEVGGRLSAFNNHVCADPKDNSVIKVHGADGSVRAYQNFGYGDFYLRWERLPNGNKVHYQWHEVGGVQRLKRVATTDGAAGKTYAWMEIDYVMHGKWLDRIEVKTSDRQKICYKIANKKGEKNTFWALEKVESSARPMQRYEYWGNKETKYFVSDRYLPDERRLRIDYYLKGNNPLKDGNVKIKKKDDKKIMRVKRLRLPLLADQGLQSIFEFYYHPGRYLHKGGWTIVKDPYGNPTKYSHNEFFLLASVDHHEYGKGVFAKEEFEWSKYDSEKGHWLKEKVLRDGQGNALRKVRYHYDKKGNVEGETLEGDLTGQGNHGECYRVFRKYNKANLVTEEKFPNGKTIEYHYCSNTNLVHQKLILDQGVIKIRNIFIYEGSVLKRKIIDDGRTRNPQDLQGVSQRLIMDIHPRKGEPFLDFPDVIEEKYLDLDSGQLRLLGRQKIERYSSFGKPEKVVYFDAEGNERFAIEHSYDARGRLSSETDAIGRVKTFEYDANDNVIAEDDPENAFDTRRGYDIANRLAWEKKDNRLIRFEYDFLSHKMTDIHFQGTATRYKNDPFGHPIKIQKPAVMTLEGHAVVPEVNQVYNALGRVAREKDSEGNVTRTFYTCRGKPYRIIYPDGYEERYRYNFDGEVTVHIRPGGTKTVYGRDFLNRVTKKKIFSKEGELLSEETYVYNAFHLMKKVAPDGVETFYEYDGVGRKCREITQDHIKTFEYDALGREFKVILGETRVMVKEYDLVNRVLEEREGDLEGNAYSSARFTYDDFSNKIAITKEVQVGDAVERTDYDTFKREVKKTDPLGNETTIDYDDFFVNALGQKVLQKVTTNPNGTRTVEEYDALKRLVKLEKWGPDGSFLLREEFFYDLNGNKRRQESTLDEGQKIVKAWEYDKRGRVSKLIEAPGDPLQKVTTYTYTPDGLKKEVIKPDGVVIFYTYDGLGRQDSIRTSDGSCHYCLKYDSMGHIVESLDLIHDLKTDRKYDHFGNLLHETLANHLALDRTYDHLSRQVDMTLPDGSQVRYGYDPYHLKSIKRTNSQREVLYHHLYTHYDRGHNLIEEQLLGNGGLVSHQVDLYSRRIQSESIYSTERIPLIDPNGNVKEYDRFAEGEEEYSTFDYDFLDQLTVETGLFEHDYAYDSHHNRLQKNDTEYTHDTLHQLLSTTEATYDHDLNGNRTLWKTGNDQVTYTYDGLDRLTQIRSGDKAVRFSYDSWGRCFTKTSLTLQGREWIPSKIIPYLYDDQNELGAYPDELRILGLGRGAEIGATVAIEKNSQLYIPIHDLFGNIIALLNADGEPIESYRFSSFGEEAIPAKPLVPWRYQSKRKVTHLVYFGRRFYDPETGRWLSPDPKGFNEGPNLYQYVGNNPFINFDLYGLSVENNRDSSSILQDFSYACYYSFRATLEGYAKLEFSNMSFSKHFHQALSNLAKGDKTPPIDHSCVFHVGEKTYANVEFIGTNGIRTTKQEAYEMARTISAELNGARVTWVYNNTHGLLDLLDFFNEKSGLQTNVSRLFHREMKAKLDTGKRVVDHIYSEGHAIFNSVERMFTQEEKSRLELYGFGSVDPISKSSGDIVQNNISRNDWVSFLASPNQHIFHSTMGSSHVHYLAPNSKNPLTEHSFHGDTYTKVRQDINREIIERHGLE